MWFSLLLLMCDLLVSTSLSQCKYQQHLMLHEMQLQMSEHRYPKQHLDDYLYKCEYHMLGGL
jgi:hypothetical protein